MKYVRDQTGRFPERPHYEPRELDILFERLVSKFLRSRYGKIKFPIATEDLTVLIERDTGDFDSCADLSCFGEGVEGVTEFSPNRKPTVRISQELANSSARENRLRTTLTHEYGHVTLHAHLFALNLPKKSLFDRGKTNPGVIACKRDTIITSSRTDWMEWQAGYACGAVLMPASYVRSVIDGFRKRNGLYGLVSASSPHGQDLIDLVMEAFQVSNGAARVRLSVLGFLGTPSAVGALLT